MKIKINKDVLVTIAIIILVIAVIGLSLIIILEKKNRSDAQNAVGKAMEYVKKYGNASDATLVGINNTAFKIKNLYQFAIETNGQKYSLFITSDGRYLIAENSIVDITQPVAVDSTTTNTAPEENNKNNN